MRNPYFINEQSSVSFSGGRTSAYMLYRILKAHGGTLPDYVKVVFANTGKEMPQTLDFVKRCGDEWDVEITWLEYAGRTLKAGVKKADVKAGVKAFDYKYNVVKRESASRNGEPFMQALVDVGGLPNAMARWCSGQLKIRTMNRYLIGECGFETPYPAYLGIRGDEQRRAAKLNGRIVDYQEVNLPLWIDGVSAKDVGDFWSNNSFDLELPNNKGVTDWGNCDLCFLKGTKKRLSIIRERPDLAGWWVGAEDKFSDNFDRKGLRYKQMQIIATTQQSFDLGFDEFVPCYCGD